MSDASLLLGTVPFPALLRAARNRYALAIRTALDGAGFDDVPKNGTYLIAAVQRGTAPLSLIIRQLAISKQAASQLVDTLVLRGYLTRTTDESDRRRFTLELTERGKDAAEVSRTAVATIDAELLAQLGADSISQARKVLFALATQTVSAQE